MTESENTSIDWTQPHSVSIDWKPGQDPIVYVDGQEQRWKTLSDATRLVVPPRLSQQAQDTWPQSGEMDFETIEPLPRYRVDVKVKSWWRKKTNWQDCRVYWGSHGCFKRRGHRGHCLCDCECKRHPDPGSFCVCAYPYYGPDTKFYGEDVEARGLPTYDDDE